MRHALSPLFVGPAGGRKPLARRWVSFREPGHGFQDLLTLSRRSANCRIRSTASAEGGFHRGGGLMWAPANAASPRGLL